jgi:excisionase family DNA binding protein
MKTERLQMQDGIPDKLLFRPDEVARIFDVHVNTVYLWYSLGQLEHIKVGGVIRIKRGEIMRKLK